VYWFLFFIYVDSLGCMLRLSFDVSMGVVIMGVIMSFDVSYSFVFC